MNKFFDIISIIVRERVQKNIILTSLAARDIPHSLVLIAYI